MKQRGRSAGAAMTSVPMRVCSASAPTVVTTPATTRSVLSLFHKKTWFPMSI